MTGEESQELDSCGVACQIRKQRVLDGRERQVYVRIPPSPCEPSTKISKADDSEDFLPEGLLPGTSCKEDFAWVWDDSSKSHDVVLCNHNKEVYFHPDYSCGTAAVRGGTVFCGEKEHYWEIKMTSAVYGTDMMIGVGTISLNLDKYKTQYCSLIGRDSESWGLSYFGTFHSNGKSQYFSKKFDRDTVIGVHLDMWKGTLSFFKNGEPLGVAAQSLQGKELYPIVSSTAARTKMKLLCSHTTNVSLQLLCCKAIFRCLVNRLHLISNLPLPERLIQYLYKQMRWIPKTEPTVYSQGPVPKRIKR